MRTRKKTSVISDCKKQNCGNVSILNQRSWKMKIFKPYTAFTSKCAKIQSSKFPNRRNCKMGSLQSLLKLNMIEPFAFTFSGLNVQNKKSVQMLYRFLILYIYSWWTSRYILVVILCNMSLLADLFVCFVALRPKSTAMVIAGRPVHLITLFPGQAWTSG